MEARITRFLRHHHVLTLCTTSSQGSWTAHCFYAYMTDHKALVFTTDPETRHGRNMLLNPNVSGGIALETKIIGKIRGIQLTGHVVPLDSLVIPEKAGECRIAYIKKFPFALATKLDLWILYINYIKMTDNRLGFGKKVLWEREL
ncbi:MAG: pyridoxamine 5'-phosphate oxidase family protein [Bacteroidia bacterium]|nr:pyridoxamine 5'-phosphate oxidase family protein [Bacteroidia bacterium]